MSAKVEMNFYEISNKDYTGITVEIKDEQDQVVAAYRNYDDNDLAFRKFCWNNSHTFELQNVLSAKNMIESCPDFEIVDLVELQQTLLSLILGSLQKHQLNSLFWGFIPLSPQEQALIKAYKDGKEVSELIQSIVESMRVTEKLNLKSILLQE
jgi:hypothetical protein